jgi:prepilin peptidase CpaA
MLSRAGEVGPHDPVYLAGLAIMVAAASVAAIIDVRTRRVPNLLTGSLVVVALVSHAVADPHELGAVLLWMLGVFAAGTVAFALGWFGGGDVKLVTACTGIVAPHGAFPFLVAVLVAGAGLALVAAIRRRRVFALLRSTAAAAFGLPATERWQQPYAVAVAAGSLVYTIRFLVTVH